MRTLDELAPPRWVPRRGPEEWDRAEESYPGRLAIFNRPRCDLYSRPLVDELPPRCPLRASQPLEAVQQVCDAAWDELRPGGTPGVGADLLDRVETCVGCIRRQLGHPVIARLRRRAGGLP
jgi:hypothetical protein